MEEIQQIKNEAIGQLSMAENDSDIENIRITYLGRNGKLTNLIKNIKNINPEDKKQYGILLNDAKKTLEDILNQRSFDLTNKNIDSNWFDISKPGTKPNVGNLHPITTVLSEIVDIFTYLGYQIADGPEIETDYYNFEALNIPPDHPARDMQQTFYIEKSQNKNIKDGHILRTQTSAMQGRVMENIKPPFRVLVPGTNYRYEQIDASHGFQFQQVEGFVVNENIQLTDLFGTIDYVLKRLFGDNAKIKFAVTNFPFVEPGVDTYLGCTICKQKGCSFCKNTGWSEIMPSGMIHPNVFEKAGIDSKKYTGFAFAIGSSRVVNLKYQIKDLRTLTTADLRILNQF